MQRRQLIAAGLGAALSAPFSTWAQDAWPAKPVKLIVPFPPGGPTDVMGRTAAKVMSEKLGQPFVVENKAGAGGNIGTEAIAKAPADGYTIGLSAISSLAIAPHLYAKVPFSVEKDFAPISLVGTSPCAIVDKLQAAWNEGSKLPEAVSAFEAISADIRVQTPAQFADFMRTENTRWGELIRKLNIKLD